MKIELVNWKIGQKKFKIQHKEGKIQRKGEKRGIEDRAEMSSGVLEGGERKMERT